jgi:hypothetical protein
MRKQKQLVKETKFSDQKMYETELLQTLVYSQQNKYGLPLGQTFKGDLELYAFYSIFKTSTIGLILLALIVTVAGTRKPSQSFNIIWWIFAAPNFLALTLTVLFNFKHRLAAYTTYIEMCQELKNRNTAKH